MAPLSVLLLALTAAAQDLPQAQAPARLLIQQARDQWPRPDGEDADGDFGVDGAEALPNFHRVSDKLTRSGQPNREGLRILKTNGARTILTLRTRLGWEERLMARHLGLASVHVPMSGVRSPTYTQLDLAVAVIRGSRGGVHVHCRRGIDRTGVVVAAYRMVEQGWEPAQAAAEARRHGCCVPTFADLDAYLIGYKRHREERGRAGR